MILHPHVQQSIDAKLSGVILLLGAIALAPDGRPASDYRDVLREIRQILFSVAVDCDIDPLVMMQRASSLMRKYGPTIDTSDLANIIIDIEKQLDIENN